MTPLVFTECGPLSTPPNGRVDFSDGTTLGRVAAYACYTGYDLSHTFGRTCQSDGTWSYTEPTCVIRGTFLPSIFRHLNYYITLNMQTT